MALPKSPLAKLSVKLAWDKRLKTLFKLEICPDQESEYTTMSSKYTLQLGTLHQTLEDGRRIFHAKRHHSEVVRCNKGRDIGYVKGTCQ